jgi:Tol biopolymer transport system component
LDVSPDGKFLIFGTVQRDKGISSLMLMSTSGGDARELVDVGTDGVTATWGPDGKHVYYMRYRGQRSTLWRIAPEGGTPERLWQIQQQGLGFSFHPTGNKIAFFSQEMASEVWVMEKFR